MLKDKTGNPLKVGDKVLLNLAGQYIGVIGHIEEGGLTVLAPGTRHGTTEMPGSVVVEVDLPMSFDPKQNTTLFKYVPHDTEETKTDAKPN